MLVTGGLGFVGAATCRRLAEAGHSVVATTRKPVTAASGQHTPGLLCTVDALDDATDWTAPLRGVDAVIHLAARVHTMRERAADPLAEYRKVNRDGTLNLAKAAVRAGVTRMIFLSTIKVNGEATLPGCAFRADDVPAPVDPYALSKYEAELGLRELASDTGLQVVTLRPPLIYGPGVGGNFLTMMRWIERGVPLPFGAVDNRRSLLALDNLVDLIERCLTHPAAAQQTLLAGDEQSLSTPQLIRLLAGALGRPARLVALPPGALRMLSILTGRQAQVRRLCESLLVESEQTRTLLGWQPRFTVAEALRDTAHAFQQRQR